MGYYIVFLLGVAYTVVFLLSAMLYVLSRAEKRVTYATEQLVIANSMHASAIEALADIEKVRDEIRADIMGVDNG